MDDLQSLTGTSLSSAVAQEVMGWHIKKFIGFAWWYDSEGNRGLYVEEWGPHANRNDSHIVIAEIQRRGLQRQFVQALFDGCDSDYSKDQEWYLLTCPPSDICRAALRVVREEKQC